MLAFWGFFWREDRRRDLFGCCRKGSQSRQIKTQGCLVFRACSPCRSVHSWPSQPCLLPRQPGEVEYSSLTLISSSSRGTGTGENLSPDTRLPFDSTALEQEHVIAWSPPTHSHSSWGPFHSLQLYKSSLLWGTQRHVLGVSKEGGGLLVLSLETLLI